MTEEQARLYKLYERAMDEAQVIMWLMEDWDETHPKFEDFNKKLCGAIAFLDLTNRWYWEG